MCFKEIDHSSFHYLSVKVPTICSRCFNELNPKFLHFKVGRFRALSIYDYDEKIKSMLFQLKGCADIEIAPSFLEYFRHFIIIKYFGYIVVPAPSSKNSDLERGFNHVCEIFKFMPNKMYRCIEKTSDVKQADLNFKERSQIIKHLRFNKSYNVANKKILIVDDVLTTGSTVEAMVKLLIQNGAKKIKILVMARTQKHSKMSVS